jgi:hypothetical protein
VRVQARKQGCARRARRTRECHGGSRAAPGAQRSRLDFPMALGGAPHPQ